jgi:pantoate--beta-alanine ligase
MIQAAGDIRIDYVALVDPTTLDAVATIDQSVVALVAVRVGETRLLDNMLIDVPPSS